MVLGVKSQEGKQGHSIRIRKLENQAEMTESEAIQSVVTQVVIQAATAVVKVMREIYQ